MTLPSIGNLQTTQNTNKQLSQIRSYLNQLKDELEAELMNVGYDNLSADLKKRLSTMSDDIQIQGDSITANQEYVSANMVTASQVEATIASFHFVTASEVVAKVVDAGFLTADEIAAKYINASYIIGLNGFYDNLNCSNFKVGTISAGRISSAIMRTEAFSAANICGLINSPNNGLTITTETLRAQNYSYYTDTTGSGPTYHPLTLKTFTVNGTTYRCLGV